MIDLPVPKLRHVRRRLYKRRSSEFAKSLRRHSARQEHKGKLCQQFLQNRGPSYGHWARYFASMSIERLTAGHLGSAFYLSCDIGGVTGLQGRDFERAWMPKFMIMFFRLNEI